MTGQLDRYAAVVGEDVIDQLRQLAEPLSGARVVHVNSTRVGGGVAEILATLVPLMNELGLDATWEVIQGNSDFYRCTKHLHNALQGNRITIPDALIENFERTNAANAERLRPALEHAEVVFIHDPQPAPLLGLCPWRRGRWIWRCHIDVSRPYRQVWRYVRDRAANYDASVFSRAAFAQPLPHAEYLIPPSIDPLSDKNVELSSQEIETVRAEYGLDPDRPLLLQVSRFDRFKDPIGVIRGFNLARRFMPSLQLVLAGGGAADDPEGEAVLDEVRTVADGDPDVHVLLLPPDANRTINALQRAADIVLQKSLREGFGLTVAEALWKGKPVIGGNAGGIRRQVINHHTGFLVDTPEGMALRVRYLLQNPNTMLEMGKKGRRFVRENFLLTRQLREYLTLMVSLLKAAEERITLR
jgi:trehalose synthase